jgi:hypothetical protein
MENLIPTPLPQLRRSNSFKSAWADFERKIRQLATSAGSDVDDRDDRDIEHSRKKWGWAITLLAVAALFLGVVFAPPEVCVPTIDWLLWRNARMRVLMCE